MIIEKLLSCKNKTIALPIAQWNIFHQICICLVFSFLERKKTKSSSNGGWGFLSAGVDKSMKRAAKTNSMPKKQSTQSLVPYDMRYTTKSQCQKIKNKRKRKACMQKSLEAEANQTNAESKKDMITTFVDEFSSTVVRKREFLIKIGLQYTQKAYVDF